MVEGRNERGIPSLDTNQNDKEEQKRDSSHSSEGNGLDMLDMDEIDQDYSPRQARQNMKKNNDSALSPTNQAAFDQESNEVEGANISSSED